MSDSIFLHNDIEKKKSNNNDYSQDISKSELTLDSAPGTEKKRLRCSIRKLQVNYTERKKETNKETQPLTPGLIFKFC